MTRIVPGAVLALCAILVASACLGGMQARMETALAISKRTTAFCQELVYADSIDDGGTSLIGGPLDLDSGLARRLPTLITSIGTIARELQRAAGVRADLSMKSLLASPLAALEGQLGDAQQRVTELATRTMADPRVSIGAQRFARQLDGFVEHARELRDLVTRITVAGQALEGCLTALQVGSLAPAAQWTATLTLVEHLRNCPIVVATATTASAAASASPGKGMTALGTPASALEEIARASDEFVHASVAFTTSFEQLRAVIDAETNQAGPLTQPAADARAYVEDIAGTLFAQRQWLTEGAAVLKTVRQLAQLRSGDARGIAEAAATLGKRYLARRVGGAAHVFFQIVRGYLRRIDHQLARLADEGYGLGGVAAGFAAEPVSRIVERAGRSLGRALAQLGDGAKGFLHETCTALEQGDDDAFAILGMAPFYTGMIGGYEAPPATQAPATGTGPTRRVMLSPSLQTAEPWAQSATAATVAARSVAATVPSASGSGSGSSPRWWRVVLLADAGDEPPDPEPAGGETRLSLDEIDLLADWAALRDCHVQRVWRSETGPCDRNRTRLDAVEVLLVAPELVLDFPGRDRGPEAPGVPADAGVSPPADAVPNAVSDAPVDTPDPDAVRDGGPHAPTDGGTGGSAAGVTRSVFVARERTIDQILVSVHLPAAPPANNHLGERSDPGRDVDLSPLLAAIRTLATQHKETVQAHNRLVDALCVREQHWLGNQFIASLCGGLQPTKAQRAAHPDLASAFACSVRDQEDAVATINVEPPVTGQVRGLPTGEWATSEQLEHERFCTPEADAARATPCRQQIEAHTACARQGYAGRRVQNENPECVSSRAPSREEKIRRAHLRVLNERLVQLSATMRSLASQLLPPQAAACALPGASASPVSAGSAIGAPVNHPRILVTGSASSLPITCAQLAFRLRTQRQVLPCAGHDVTAGVELCYTLTPTTLTLDLGPGLRRPLTCDPREPAPRATARAGGPACAGVECEDSAALARVPNRMLAVLRGWAAAQVVRHELGADWDRDISFDRDPPPPLGLCKDKGDACAEFQNVQLHVFAR